MRLSNPFTASPQGPLGSTSGAVHGCEMPRNVVVADDCGSQAPKSLNFALRPPTRLSSGNSKTLSGLQSPHTCRGCACGPCRARCRALALVSARSPETSPLSAMRKTTSFAASGGARIRERERAGPYAWCPPLPMPRLATARYRHGPLCVPGCAPRASVPQESVRSRCRGSSSVSGLSRVSAAVACTQH